jgi:hypothetical protein
MSLHKFFLNFYGARFFPLLFSCSIFIFACPPPPISFPMVRPLMHWDRYYAKIVWSIAKEACDRKDTEENLLADTLYSLYDKNNGGFNTTAASEGFVFGSESLTYKSTNNEKNSEGDEVFNNSKAEKSFVISSTIKGASTNVEDYLNLLQCRSAWKLLLPHSKEWCVIGYYKAWNLSRRLIYLMM